MARPVEFPKARHIALCGPGQAEAEARAEGCDAIIKPFEQSEPDAPHPPLPDPPPPEGALPAATAAPALQVGAQEEAPEVTGSPPPPPASTAFPRLISVDLSQARDEHEACRKPDGSLVTDESLTVRCPSSTAGREHAGRAVAWATHLGEGVLLEGLDRWYRAGPAEAGWCKSCEFALIESLRENYGEHLLTFDVLEGLRSRGTFAGAREALRLSEAVDAGKRAALRARDEARRGRGVEIAVLGRVGSLSAVALVLARHLDGMLFELPTLDAEEALLPLLVARAALGQRPAVAVLPASIEPAKVKLFSALALACDVDVMLPAGASPAARAALAVHRRYQAIVRERFRPSEALLDAAVLVSPFAEHWSRGVHLRSASAVAAALARAHVQIGARLALGEPLSGLLVLAGCGQLSAQDGERARRHVESGGDALVVGRCATVDEEGRPLGLVFPEARLGMERVGEGRVLGVALDQDAPAGQDAQVLKAARELLGRGRAQVTLSGRARLFARAYLDPERKLDVHFVNLEEKPAQGVLLGVAGQAAGASRSGYWFAPERDSGKDGERIVLNPSGFSLSTVLPSIGGSALLTIPR
jgi:hypothetical protein